MFVVSTIEADVRVHPRDLSKPPFDAVTDVLEEQYLDKVVPDLGLIVSLYEVLSVAGGHIYPNDGAAYFKAVFRAVVFRPFEGEVLIGRIIESTREGIRVSLGFFNDVVVPEHALQTPSFYNEAEGLWVWRYESSDYFMDLGEPVRLRVRSLRFNPTPSAAAVTAARAAAAEAEAEAAAAAAAAAATAGLGQQLLTAPPIRHAPLEVIGDVDGDGLGLTAWWVQEGSGADAMDDAGDG